MAASGNQDTLFALATTASLLVPREHGRWTSQHRHPDAKHRLVLGHVATRALARATSKAFVEAGYRPATAFRVKRSKDPDDHG